MTKPLLVIVSGAPGAGKSTLAARLGAELDLPVFDRDDLKDAMFDTLGWSDRDWSQRVGGAAYELLYLITERLLGGGVSHVLDTNFYRGAPADRFRAMRERVPYSSVEVHCRADAPVLARRFRERWHYGGRHPGHTAEFTDEDSYMQALSDRGFYAPVGIGPVIEVDTTHPERIDLEGIVTGVRQSLEGAHGPENG